MVVSIIYAHENTDFKAIKQPSLKIITKKLKEISKKLILILC